MGSEKAQRGFWDPVYDRLAGLYDAVDWLTGNTTHRLRRRALAHLPPAGSRVLEIGFGSGRLHLDLAARYALAGTDRAPGMARLAARRLAAHRLASLLAVGDFRALPWRDGQFDAVLATFALSAVAEVGQALDEMVRVTRPGGRVVIVDAGEALDGNRAARCLARLWEAMGDYMRDEVPLLETKGLDVVREDYGPWRCIHVTVGTLPAAEAEGSAEHA